MNIYAEIIVTTVAVIILMGLIYWIHRGFEKLLWLMAVRSKHRDKIAQMEAIKAREQYRDRLTKTDTERCKWRDLSLDLMNKLQMARVKIKELSEKLRDANAIIAEDERDYKELEGEWCALKAQHNEQSDVVKALSIEVTKLRDQLRQGRSDEQELHELTKRRLNGDTSGDTKTRIIDLRKKLIAEEVSFGKPYTDKDVTHLCEKLEGRGVIINPQPEAPLSHTELEECLEWALSNCVYAYVMHDRVHYATHDSSGERPIYTPTGLKKQLDEFVKSYSGS